MFSLDDRTGNIATTVLLFAAAGAILYLARYAFLILLLSLMLAYLLEPAVTFIQKHSLLGSGNRTWAIAQVYLIGTLALGGLVYELGPRVVAQARNLNASAPGILRAVSNARAFAALGGGHGPSAAQQMRMQESLERVVASIAQVAASSIWLFAIPILAIFILRDGRQMVTTMIDDAERRFDGSPLRRILQRVDTMLANLIRGQLALAGLSFVFYSLSMLVLGFPYAFALGALGGALEFLPAVGWIASAVTILTVGSLAHAHWIWMAALLVVWRLVQNYVNSPRIMGKNLELQPLTVVFALMVGGQVGGITGVYLSVPTVAALRIAWMECFPARDPSTLNSEQPPVQTKA